MTGLEDLVGAGFDVTLSADAPARLVRPPIGDGETWWKVGDATWLRALPSKSALIQQPKGTAFASASFRADRPGLDVDSDADWVKESDALINLGDALVDGLVGQLQASVPTLPVRMPGRRLSELLLDWDAGSPAIPEARRGLRLAQSKRLAGYVAEVDAETGQAIALSAPEATVAACLLDHLSTIPRPANTRVYLSPDEEGGLVLSWEQKGNPDLLWNAATLSWNAVSRRVEVVRRSADDAQERRRLAAFAQLLAMATAVEAATGGSSFPLSLHFSTVSDRTLKAMLTISPAQWGFDLPQLVHRITQGQNPDDLSFRMNEK